MKLKTILLSLISVFSIAACSSGEGERHNPIDYKAGEIKVNATTGELKILALSDIHLSNKDNQDLQLDFINLTITDAVNMGTNLIVLDGDSFTFAEKATAKKLFKFIDSYNIPWTITFGNHDEQCYFSVTWLTSFLNDYGSNCVFKDIQGDDVMGSANFYIDVKDNSNNLFERVIVMDSNRYNFSQEYFGYDYFKQNQIDWYERLIKTSQTTESLMFFHIPLPEFETAYNLYQQGSPEVEYLGGSYGEGISCPQHNSKMFDKIVELGSTKGIFVGHDHVNDSALKYKGVVLSYVTNSTDRIYKNEAMMGGQVITIKPNHEMELTRIHHSYSEVED